MRIKLLTPLALAVLVVGCESSLVTDPTAAIDETTALGTERGIELGVNGAYRALTAGGLYGRTMPSFPDLYADNLDFTGTYTTDREFSLRSVSPSNGAVSDTWTAAYQGISRVNNVLAAIPEVENMAAAKAAQYAAEAHFIRALNYYLLASWFGGVPIVTEPSHGVGPESLVSRASLAEVWAQVESDLQAASSGLPATSQGRASQAAVNALRARVSLEQGKFAQARDQATAVISTSAFSLVPVFRNLWATKHSAESIFELTYTVNSGNSLAFWFYPQALGGRLGFSPTAGLYAAFGAGDQRRAASIALSGSTRYVDKYTRIANGDDNVMVLRLAELYLIRAEANARLNAPAATVRQDINVVRQRAGATLLDETVASQAALLDAVLHERRLELAFEGHRFFDLRRLGKAPSVLTMPADRLVLPIPQNERDVNPNLEQNPGY